MGGRREARREGRGEVEEGEEDGQGENENVELWMDCEEKNCGKKRGCQYRIIVSPPIQESDLLDQRTHSENGEGEG